jgi:hypothetical protein
MNLKLFRKVKRRMLKRLGILATSQKGRAKIPTATEYKVDKEKV